MPDALSIAPTISYSGTVTGKLIKIEGAEAHKFVKNHRFLTPENAFAFSLH